MHLKLITKIIEAIVGNAQADAQRIEIAFVVPAQLDVTGHLRFPENVVVIITSGAMACLRVLCKNRENHFETYIQAQKR